jgi:hypothetical protein
MVAAMSDHRSRSREVIAKYDQDGDVLYVVLGGPAVVEGDGLPNGLELDFSVESGEPCGATVIGYRRNHWQDESDRLAKLIGSHMSVDPSEIVLLIRNATSR